jgi:hypothetical protein
MRPTLLITLAMSILSAASASAQIAEPPPDGLGQVRFGSVIFTPSIGLGNIGIDRNVFNEAGERKSDFTFTVAPQLELFYGGDKLRLRATTGTGFVYYARYKTERAANPGLRLEGQWQLGRRITVLTDNSFRFRKDRPNAEVDARSRRFEMDNLVTVRTGISPRVFFDVTGRRMEWEYGATQYLGTDLERTLNRVTRSLILSTSYRLTPYTSVVTGVSLATDKFPGIADRNGTTRGVFAGLTFAKRAKISGDLLVGYSDFDADAASTRDHHGVTSDIRLSSVLSDSFSIGVLMRNELQFSYSVEDPYYLTHRYDVTAMQRLGRWFDLSAAAQYQTFDYTDASLVRAGKNNLQIYTVSPGVRFGQLRLGVYGSYSNRRTTLTGRRSHEGLRWGFVVTSSGRLTLNDDGMFVNGLGR